MPEFEERTGRALQLETPELKAIGERLLEAAKLAVERAVSEHWAPGQQAFPRNPRSLEAILLRRLKSRPAPAQERAKAWLAQRPDVERPAGLRRIDMASATPVLDQVAALQPAAQLTLDILKREGFPGPLSADVGGPAPAAFGGLALRLRRVKCHKLTSGIGNDEITLTGTGLSASGKLGKLQSILNEAPFTHDGHQRSFSPPQRFAAFKFADDDTFVLDGTALPVGWPRRYSVSFLLAEIDNGSFPEDVKDIVDDLKEKGIAELKAGIAGAIGTAATPLVGALVAALTWAVGKLTDWLVVTFTNFIIGLWEDNPFPVVISHLDLKGTTDTFSGQETSGERHWNLKAHGGHYELFFDWHLEEKKIATPLDADVLAPGVVAWRAKPQARETRIDVFMRGMDRGAFHGFEVSGGWSGWGEVPNVDATFLSAPAAASWAPGRLELFARGDDARIYHNSLNGSDWFGWRPHMHDIPDNRTFHFGAAAVSRRANWVDLFAVDANRRMIHSFWNGAAWSGWLEDLPPGLFVSGPAATARGAGRLDVLALGDDRRVYLSSWQEGGAWSVWAPIPVGTFTSAPAACDWQDERLHVFGRGDDRQIYHAFWNGSAWSSWARDVGEGTFRSGPAAVSRQAGVIDLFAVDDENRMRRSTFDGTKWSGWLPALGDGTFA